MDNREWLSLGLGLEAVPSKQQAKAASFYTVYTALNRTHLSWGCPYWPELSHPRWYSHHGSPTLTFPFQGRLHCMVWPPCAGRP